MGRVLKPSVKAISVSQTCCFPTEPTCQSKDLQLYGKRHRHTHAHTDARKHPPTHAHGKTPLAQGDIREINTYIWCGQTCPRLYTGCWHRQNKHWHHRRSSSKSSRSSHAHAQHSAGAVIYTRLERQASANK